MIARAQRLNEKVQGRTPIRVGDIVRVALDRLSKEYRKREKSRLRLHPGQDPYRIRDHYSAELFRVETIEKRPGNEQVRTDDGGGEDFRYRVRQVTPRPDNLQ